MLRQYFTENHVSLELGNCIWGFFKDNHYRLRKRVHEQDVAILKMLPPYLLKNLHEEVFLPVIVSHPFLYHFGISHPLMVSRICHSAISEIAKDTHQELFAKGDGATSMYVITAGRLEYVRKVARATAGGG